MLKHLENYNNKMLKPLCRFSLLILLSIPETTVIENKIDLLYSDYQSNAYNFKQERKKPASSMGYEIFSNSE